MDEKERIRAYQRAYYEANREKIKKRNSAYARKNSEKTKAYKRRRYEERRDEILVEHKAYYEAHKDEIRAKNAAMDETARERRRIQRRAQRRIHPKEPTEKHREATRRYAREHPARRCAHRAKRRAAKLRATPSWLTDEDLRRMRAVYEHAVELSKLTGVKMHVDHIVPLRSKLVCGLHVPWNLQILTAQENCKKNNRVQ